jgi:hypothetical protein
MTQEQYLKRFQEIIDEMYHVTKAKNSDYATPKEALRNFKTFGAFGVLVRISDKIARLRTVLEDKREFTIKETAIDTITDMAVYSVILRIIMEEEAKENELNK